MMTGRRQSAATTAVRDIDVKATERLTLRGRWWRRAEPRGVVIITHGFGEHGGSYRQAAESLGAALDLDVVAVDLRGHGRSPGRRGVVRRYEDLTDDVAATLDWTARQRRDLPRFLLGHSNGGQVALRVALDGRAAV